MRERLRVALDAVGFKFAAHRVERIAALAVLAQRVDGLREIEVLDLAVIVLFDDGLRLLVPDIRAAVEEGVVDIVMDAGAVVVACVRKLDEVLHRLRRALARKGVFDLVIFAEEVISDDDLGLCAVAGGKHGDRCRGKHCGGSDRKDAVKFFHENDLRYTAQDAPCGNYQYFTRIWRVRQVLLRRKA